MNAANGPAAAVDDIRKDLQTLREDMLRLAGQVSALVSATSDQTIGDVKERMRVMGDAVSDLSERGKGIATDIIDDVGATLEGHPKGTADDHPPFPEHVDPVVQT